LLVVGETDERRDPPFVFGDSELIANAQRGVEDVTIICTVIGAGEL
jgi:hypothetical protein